MIAENSPNTEPVKKKGGLLNVVLFILLFISVISISILVYMKSNNIDIQNISLKEFFKSAFSFMDEGDNGANTWEIKYDYSENLAFIGYNGFIIECSKNSIEGLDEKGEEQWVLPISVNNPVLKTAGPYLLIGDTEGNEIYLLEGKSFKWNKKIDNSIINVDINDEGYVSVIYETKGYRGKVTVFNSNGNEVLSRTISEDFPLLSKVSPSGKYFVINSVNVRGIKAETNLVFGNMKKGNTKEKTPIKDKLYPFAWYLNNDSLVTIGDSSIICFDQDANEKWKYEFPDRKIYCSDVLQKKYAVIALSGVDKSGSMKDDLTEIKLYDKDGESGGISIENKVVGIKSYTDIIGINTGREVYFINSKGKLLDKCTSKADVSEIFFINRQDVALVTKNKIIINHLKT